MGKELDISHEEMNKLVGVHVELITVDSQAFKQALDRAAKFLVISSLLASYKLELERRKAKVITLREAFYAMHMSKNDAKNVTEKKAMAEGSREYTDQRESVEELEAMISWCRAHMEIFNNAHVTFRQMSKEE